MSAVDTASLTHNAPTAGGLLGEDGASNGANKMAKVEALKLASDHLREPLASELENAEDHFSNGAVQILKFHGSYQQTNRDYRHRDWSMMLRLRSPAGRVPAQLYLALDALADQYGNGTLRATTRQTFQLHGIPKQDLRTVLGTIVRNLGSTLAACGDINRNVMAPAAPYTTGGYPAARRLADDVAALLTPQAALGAYLDLWVDGDMRYRLRSTTKARKVDRQPAPPAVHSGDDQEPLYGSRYMPRKFKVGVTVPGDNSIDVLTQDVGLVVFTDTLGRLVGANVYVGGGMGRTHNKEDTFARTADPLGYVQRHQVLPLVKAIVALQRDHGDRQTRRHARLKYLIHDQGIDWFKDRLAHYFQGEIRPLREEPSRKLEHYLGWQQQGEDLWFVGLPVMTGRVAGPLKAVLRELVERYQVELRVTPNQDILLCGISTQHKQEIQARLDTIGLQTSAMVEPTASHGLACPALPTCGLAITESERAFPEVLARLDTLRQSLGIEHPLLVRMTGCPNGCSRPYMAEVGLVGSAAGHYQLWLGGTPGLTTLARPVLERLPLENLEAVLQPLFSHWMQTAASKSFGDFCQDHTTEQLQELLGAG